MIRTILFASAAFALTACQPASEAPADAPATTATDASSPPADPSAPPAGLEEMLRRLLPTAGEVRYAYASVDLDGDGDSDALAYPMGAMICGSGGCPLYILSNEGDYWRPVTVTSVTQTPVGVLHTSTNGWVDLAVSTGGGGAAAGWVRLTFDGQSYPTNPTVAPAEPIADGTDIVTLIAAAPETRVLP